MNFKEKKIYKLDSHFDSKLNVYYYDRVETNIKGKKIGYIESIECEVDDILDYKDYIDWKKVTDNTLTLNIDYLCALREHLIFDIDNELNQELKDELENISNNQIPYLSNKNLNKKVREIIGRKIDWSSLGFYKNVNIDFILEYGNHIVFQFLTKNKYLSLEVILFLFNIFELDRKSNEISKYENSSHKYFKFKEKFINNFSDTYTAFDYKNLISINKGNITFDKKTINILAEEFKKKEYRNFYDFLIGTKVLIDLDKLKNYSENINLWKVLDEYPETIWDKFLFSKLISGINCFVNENYRFLNFKSYIESFEYKKLQLLSKIKLDLDVIFLFTPYFIRSVTFIYERKSSDEYIDEHRSYHIFEFLLKNPNLNKYDFLSEYFLNQKKMYEAFEEKGYNKGYLDAYQSCFILTNIGEPAQLTLPEKKENSLYIVIDN